MLKCNVIAATVLGGLLLGASAGSAAPLGPVAAPTVESSIVQVQMSDRMMRSRGMTNGQMMTERRRMMRSKTMMREGSVRSM